MKELQQQVIEWAKEKGINNPDNQRLKVLEEVGETAGAILKGDREEILMELGDVAVTIIIYHHLVGIETSMTEEPNTYPLNNKARGLEIIADLFTTNNSILICVDDIARMNNSTLEECLTMTWDKIKDRQGKTVNGTFIKNE